MSVLESVQSCPAKNSDRHAGWHTKQALRSHLDQHLLGVLTGSPSEDWLDQEGLQSCRRCSRLVSRRTANGMHRTCWGAQEAQRLRSSGLAHLSASTSSNLPEEEELLLSLEEIGRMDIATREFLEPNLFAKAEKLYVATIRNGVDFNLLDAWAFEDGQDDTAPRKRCRRAWTEFLMFCKTCLPQLPGGKSKANRNKNLILGRLTRWENGERMTLWNELHDFKRPKTAKSVPAEVELQRRQQATMALAEHGAPRKAVNRLSGPGLAPHSDTITAKMKSKFVPPPDNQAASWRPPPPPANVLTPELVAKSIRSFDTGVGAGPSGCRPDFLKQIVGAKEDRDGLHPVTDMANLLANGQAPKKLRPFIGGASGFAFRKCSKPNADGVVEEDARPVCSGDVWRRVVGKALFRSEEDTFKEHLQPHQLAVSVKSGAEVMTHLARGWMEKYREDPTRILLDTDEGNAHNEVDRHTFLLRAREVAPGICRWLEFIYPTQSATMVFYKDLILDSRAGGQQGCPLMAVCHAMVERIKLEATGLIPVDPATTPVADVMDPPPRLDIVPMFADDCIIAGVAGEVLRTVTHWKRIMPRLGLRFSKLDAIPSAGPHHSIDLTAFEAIGCKCDLSQTAIVMKSPIGNTEFCEKVIAERVNDSLKVIDAIAALPKPHVAHYLLRYQISRMDYIKRCTPLPSCERALRRFDQGVHIAFERILSRQIPAGEWAQNTAPLRHGGLGFRQAVETADEAYFASLLATRELRQTLGETDTNALEHALSRTNARLPMGDALPFSIPEDPARSYTQQDIGRRLAKAKADAQLERSTTFARARLNAYSAPGAGVWSNAVPSQTLDRYLSNGELLTTVSLQLGVDVYDSDSICRFCGMVLDRRGVHAASCTAGGDISCRHNLVRDIIFHYCLKGRLNPELEKPGLLEDESIFINLRRPADVFAEMGRATGSDGLERTALDIKIINALGQGHIDDTANSGLAAAAAYRDHQLQHLSTADLCRERGIVYEPLVFTTQGGVEGHAEATISRIAASVAANEDMCAAQVKADILQSISLSIARSVAKAIRRRRPPAGDCFNGGSRRQAVEADSLDVEMGFQLQ